MFVGSFRPSRAGRPSRAWSLIAQHARVWPQHEASRCADRDRGHERILELARDAVTVKCHAVVAVATERERHALDAPKVTVEPRLPRINIQKPKLPPSHPAQASAHAGSDNLIRARARSHLRSYKRRRRTIQTPATTANPNNPANPPPAADLAPTVRQAQTLTVL